MFFRSYTNDGDAGPTVEKDLATVSSFRLDKYDVTVGRFRQFVAAWNNGWRPAAGSGKHTHLNGGQGLANSGSSGTYETGWLVADSANVSPTDANLACRAGYATWTNTAASQENLPINCVNWYEAAALCIWDGGFLPSDAEWEYAAAGGSQQRAYPWGSTAPGMSYQYAIYQYYYPNPSGGGCSGVSCVAPVGTATAGASLWGQLDLAGNVYQWALDWYAAYVNPCRDCAYLTSTPYGTARGGFYGSGSLDLQPPAFIDPAMSTRDEITGLRCARSP